MSLPKHSIKVDGRKTGISLEAAFWDGLKEIAVERGVSVSELVSDINSERHDANLSWWFGCSCFGITKHRKRERPSRSGGYRLGQCRASREIGGSAGSARTIS